MGKHRKIKQGSVDELKKTYAHEYTIFLFSSVETTNAFSTFQDFLTKTKRNLQEKEEEDVLV